MVHRRAAALIYSPALLFSPSDRSPKTNLNISSCSVYIQAAAPTSGFIIDAVSVPPHVERVGLVHGRRGWVWGGGGGGDACENSNTGEQARKPAPLNIKNVLF